MLLPLLDLVLPTDINLYSTTIGLQPVTAVNTEISDQSKVPFITKNPALHALEIAKTRLLEDAFGQFTPLLKSNSGKPHRISGEYISISHSGEWVVLAKSVREIGIDIQVFNDKITRIQHKFLSDNEAKLADNSKYNHLHFLWCAKEAIFKIYGENLAFKRIEAQQLPQSASGIIPFKVNNSCEHKVYYSFFENFCFALAI